MLYLYKPYLVHIMTVSPVNIKPITDNSIEMLDFPTVILGGIVSVAAVCIASVNDPHSKVQTCVEAYYSDKYNSHPTGKPTATFLTCMEKNFPRTFQASEGRYNPQNVTVRAQ